MIIDLMPDFIWFSAIVLAPASIIGFFSKSWQVRRTVIITTPCLLALGALIIFGIPRL